MPIESTGFADSKRIVEDAGRLLAMAERYTSGFWAVHDLEKNQKLCEARHKTANSAAEWFVESKEQSNG